MQIVLQVKELGGTAMIKRITRINFEEEVLRSDVPVLLEFWSDWCEPCEMMNPIVRDIAKQYGKRLKVAKINVEEESLLAALYRISQVPSFIVMENGKQKMLAIGFREKEEMQKLLESQGVFSEDRKGVAV